MHWACADIKVDAQQAPGGGNPNFFQTDPEGGTIPISSVAFDCLDDDSSNLPSTDAARVHVQVHNWSLTQANNVQVWAIYASAAGHVPSLAASPSQGNNFAFWSQFGVSGGVGTITPNLPADSPWTAIGPPITLQGIDAAHPQVASWNWTVPVLSSGDPGHYCIVCFVQSADNPITETAYDVDTVTPRNRGIGQRNLHIGPPLPPSQGPRGQVMREYIEFYNPYADAAEFDLLFDFRSLPALLEVRLQFPEMKAVEPLEHAIVGIGSRKAGSLIAQKTTGPAGSREKIIQLPPFVHEVYTARPSSRVMVQSLDAPTVWKDSGISEYRQHRHASCRKPLHIHGAPERDTARGWRQHVRGADRRSGARAGTVHCTEPRLPAVPENGKDHAGGRSAIATAVDQGLRGTRGAVRRLVDPVEFLGRWLKDLARMTDATNGRKGARAVSLASGVNDGLGSTPAVRQIANERLQWVENRSSRNNRDTRHQRRRHGEWCRVDLRDFPCDHRGEEPRRSGRQGQPSGS